MNWSISEEGLEQISPLCSFISCDSPEGRSPGLQRGLNPCPFFFFFNNLGIDREDIFIEMVHDIVHLDFKQNEQGSYKICA